MRCLVGILGTVAALSIASNALALTDSDPVSAAVDGSCSTTSVKGLATQLVDEIQCMRPGSMKSLDGAPGLALGTAVFPYLQTPAVDALLVAQKARSPSISRTPTPGAPP
jgi:hypothetical protein